MPTDSAASPSTTVTPYPDGPLIVRGDFTVQELDGTTIHQRSPVALCRCGRSATKPFCDGSHKITPRKRGSARA